LASGTSRRRINSASLTILSALKCFKYSTCFAGDVICERDDGVNGVDNPVPRWNKKGVNTRQSKGRQRQRTQDLPRKFDHAFLPDLAAQHGSLHMLSLTILLVPWDGDSQIQAHLVGTTNKAELHLLSQLEPFKHESHQDFRQDC